MESRTYLTSSLPVVVPGDTLPAAARPNSINSLRAGVLTLLQSELAVLHAMLPPAVEPSVLFQMAVIMLLLVCQGRAEALTATLH